jgi:hypothetical protein
MKDAVLEANWLPSAGPTDQMVVPPTGVTIIVSPGERRAARRPGGPCYISLEMGSPGDAVSPSRPARAPRATRNARARRASASLRGVFLLFVAAVVAPALSAQAPTGRDLLTAARKGDVVGIRRALERGVSVDATDPTFRQTALIRAAMFGQAEAARALLAARANVELGGAPDGMRALHWAARQDQGEVIRLLVAAGADVNATDGPGVTALEYGLSTGAASAVRALIAGGANPDTMRQPLSTLIGPALNPDVPGTQLDALIAVIRAGRGLERASGHVGERTALLALAGRANRPGAERVAEALVAAGANLRATDEEGRTARQIVEAWIPSQRVASYRKTLEAVAAVLRRAEERR